MSIGENRTILSDLVSNEHFGYFHTEFRDYWTTRFTLIMRLLQADEETAQKRVNFRPYDNDDAIM